MNINTIKVRNSCSNYLADLMEMRKSGLNSFASNLTLK